MKLKQILATDYKLKGIRASGPGGQHVNKVSTAIQLTFSINSSSLSQEEKEKLLATKDKRITANGHIVITAKRYKSQAQNRADAVIRLRKLITKLLHTPKTRRNTNPTSESVEKRLRKKSVRSELKKMRGKVKDL